ncbi:MAG: thiamine pyrophosphate-dependent dehydrogenase E1 component subunit alpha, partial [Gemmatimonadota bacterium]
VYYGDGATSTGAWHEGVNFAAVRRCPLVVVVEDNQYAFSTPTWKQTAAASFADKATGYGIPGRSVDGNDILAVHRATRDAAAYARSGEGPYLLEFRTYRRKGHAQHDNQGYVPPGEIEAWEERDPIDGFRRRILNEGWATSERLEEVRNEAEERIRRAAERVVGEAPPEPEWALEGVYPDGPVPTPWTRLDPPDPRRA